MAYSSEKMLKNLMVKLVLTFLLVSTTSILCAQSKPFHPEMDPIDTCIFTCDFCYARGEALVRCANECIALEGAMDWSKCRQAQNFGPQLIGFPKKFVS